MRILIVDDDEDLRSVVVRALRADGHATTAAPDLATARASLADGTDMVVLDLRLTDGFGLTLCREMRRDGSTIPILVLTAMSHVALRVEGLDAGADDFLAKPFAIEELRARVRALGRRGRMPRGLAYSYDDVALDFAARKAKKAEQEIAITAKEWAILEMLAQRMGRIVTRYDLLEGVWGDIHDSAASSLEVLVSRLRRKLGSDLIRTLRGEGYALAEGKKHAS